MPITLSEIQAFVFSGSVANYSALPDPTTVPNTYWWAQSSQGTKWLPGPLGGTYYPAGTYHSNGVSWEYMETPYQATQADVDAGVITDQFVSPNTFENAAKWGTVVPTSRTLTINGVSYDLSSDRSWTITASAYWNTVPGTPVRVNNTSFTITDVGNTNLYNLLISRTTVLKWTDSGSIKMAMVVSASYAADTVTVTIIGDTLAASATMNTFKYSAEKCKPIVFAIAGTLATGTDLTGKWKAPCPMKVFGADALHGTAGTTNATTYDINKNGSTMFTAKVSIASAATVGDGFTADDGSVLALDDVITVDCDSVSTIEPPVDAYIYLFMVPLYNQYLN